jgi:hypothetical protein
MLNKKNETKTEVQGFPIEIFPEKIQSVLLELHETTGIPIDFYAAGMLSVFSSVLPASVASAAGPNTTDSGGRT